MAMHTRIRSARRIALGAFTALAVTGLALTAVGSTGCASAGGGSTVDADPNAVDADPNRPDADPAAPDADPGAPDANVSMPDANVNTAPDANVTCPKSPCHLVDQCGCTAPLVCDLNSSSAATLAAGDTQCRAVNSPGTEAATCAGGPSTCAGGFMCIGGQCRRYCDPANDICPGTGGRCVVNITYEGANIPGAVTCTKDCDPTSTAPAGCPAGYACHVYGVTGETFSITDCETETPAGGEGVTCVGSPDCKAGYDCINIGGNPVCKQNCVLSGGSGPACATGTCTGFTEPAVIGALTYGFCN